MLSSLSLLVLQVRIGGVPVAVVMVFASAAAYSQESVLDGAQIATVTISPRISITETLTDNVRLSNTAQQSEQITEISTGVRINIDRAKFKTFLDYSLINVIYARNTSPDRSKFQNGLNTFGSLEVVDNWAFVDFTGSISQQTISAFGTQSIGNTSINANKAEVANYRLSPYVRGRVGDVVNYEARYSRAATTSDATAGFGVTEADQSLKLGGDSAFRNLGWSADFSRQNVDYSAGRATEVDRANLGFSYSITSQLNVTATAGRESNNYAGVDKQSYSTTGFGGNWSPSETTRVAASVTRRPFGDAHNLSFEHRTPRTVWRVSDSRDVSVTPSQTGLAGFGSIYDMLYRQYASVEPDPIARARLVNEFLQSNGINPNATVVSSFLTSAVSLQRRQDLSFALLGVRDTITFVATRSESSRLDTVSAGIDDFNTSSLIRQRGLSANYTHRLTPQYTLGVLVSQQNTAGESSDHDSRMRFFNVSITGRIGKQASMSVAVRHIVSSNSFAPYTETAVIGNLTVWF